MQKPAKTPRWARGLAISILAGLAIGILTILIAGFFFYRHYAAEYPTDTQNLLSALTSAVITGIGVGALAAIATGCGYTLFGLMRAGEGARRRDEKTPEQPQKISHSGENPKQ